MQTGFSEFHDDGFELPVSGLFADLDAGTGTVHLPDDFEAASPQARLHILADWQRGLARARLRAFEQLYEQVCERHRMADADELLRRFGEACGALGQEWPPEMAARLQRRRAGG